MNADLNFIIKAKDDLANAVRRFGILPLFQNSLPGFSVEDRVAPCAWGSDYPGVWEGRGAVKQQAG
ncbi:MAG: hypothetical protein LIO45_04625, partial [Clostridiales bacterium]|nr:hypothetical protein [Clostridiales bacterium]